LSGKPEETKLVGITATKILRASINADNHAPRPSEPRLKLAYPLASRKILTNQVSSVGNTIETAITVEYVGRNGVRHIVGALKRETLTDEAEERIDIYHTQVFASVADTIPTATLDRTFRMKTVKVRVEGDCRWDDIFVTMEDEKGVHRPPVWRSQTFLRKDA
jgi:hypothetical protein